MSNKHGAYMCVCWVFIFKAPESSPLCHVESESPLFGARSFFLQCIPLSLQYNAGCSAELTFRARGRVTVTPPGPC